MILYLKKPSTFERQLYLFQTNLKICRFLSLNCFWCNFRENAKFPAKMYQHGSPDVHEIHSHCIITTNTCHATLATHLTSELPPNNWYAAYLLVDRPVSHPRLQQVCYLSVKGKKGRPNLNQCSKLVSTRHQSKLLHLHKYHCGIWQDPICNHKLMPEAPELNIDDLLFKLFSAGVIKIPQVLPPEKSFSQKNADGLMSNLLSAGVIKIPANDGTGQLNQQYKIRLYVLN